MAKQSFLIVSLKGGKAKKLAQVLTNDTSLKILDYLANKDATETELAKELGLPISTVHYNLKILVDSKMIKSDEYHYSGKGKMVNHYAIANKYILIAPDKEEGLKERLKSVLPISIVLIAAAGVIQLISSRTFPFFGTLGASPAPKLLMAEEAAGALEAAPRVADFAAQAPQASQSIALWFAIGAFSALSLYLIVRWIRDRQD